MPVEGMPKEIRSNAKAINFGIIYGISAFGLARNLGIEREEACAYIKKYFERFPGIRDYMEETKAFARANGYVKTIFGRRIWIAGIKSKNHRSVSSANAKPSTRRCKAPPPTSSAAPWCAWRKRSRRLGAHAAAGA